MRRFVFLVLLAMAVGLLVWAFSTRGKEGIVLFFFGAVTLLCTLAVGGLRSLGSLLSRQKTPRTNYCAILGALAGLLFGGFVGAASGFGRVMISIFNPDLPERDFGSSFGAVGGGMFGAFLLALLGGTCQILRAQTKPPATDEECQQSLHSPPEETV